jgi:hypothetical protein
LAQKRKQMEHYEEEATQSEVTTRLHRMANLEHERTTDGYGYNDPANEYTVPTTQPQPEGQSDQYSPTEYRYPLTDSRQEDNR